MSNTKVQRFGFFVSITEHERGWGSRPDGFLIFSDREAAVKFIDDIAKARAIDRHVPDEYDSYDLEGWNPITEAEEKHIAKDGKVWRR